VRVEIHVRPNAAKPGVGGTHDGALVVKVAAAPERGAATAAALRAVAEALALPPRAVTLVHGATSRRKVVEVDVDGPLMARARARLAELCEGT
jgi:uncharacterized protein YggU (UPF0235/DUF167 family)